MPTFPPQSVYTYTSNGYRIPIANLTTYNAPIAHRSTPQNDASPTFYAGGFHKDRFFGHFETFSTFSTSSGHVVVGRLGENASHLGSFPNFWRSAGRTQGTNTPFGYAHHFAERGSATTGAMRGIFQRFGRGASNTSGQSETIFDLRGKNPNGTFKSVQYVGRYTSAHRTPFHAKYNITSQSHDYPRALYDSEHDFQITSANGAILNPLSKANRYGGRAGFMFSVFRHYGSSSTRSSDNVITLIIPTSPASNPMAIAQGGWGHDYVVRTVSPVAPISRRNWNTELDRVQIYSPYSDAVKLDFLNGIRYNSLLHSSSIWSK